MLRSTLLDLFTYTLPKLHTMKISEKERKIEVIYFFWLLIIFLGNEHIGCYRYPGFQSCGDWVPTNENEDCDGII